MKNSTCVRFGTLFRRLRRVHIHPHGQGSCLRVLTVPVPPRLALRILLKLLFCNAKLCQAGPPASAPAALIPASANLLKNILKAVCLLALISGLLPSLSSRSQPPPFLHDGMRLSCWNICEDGQNFGLRDSGIPFQQRLAMCISSNCISVMPSSAKLFPQPLDTCRSKHGVHSN